MLPIVLSCHFFSPVYCSYMPIYLREMTRYLARTIDHRAAESLCDILGDADRVLTLGTVQVGWLGLDDEASEHRSSRIPTASESLINPRFMLQQAKTALPGGLLPKTPPHLLVFRRVPALVVRLSLGPRNSGGPHPQGLVVWVGVGHAGVGQALGR